MKRGGFAAIAMKDDIIFACSVGWLCHCDSLAEAEIRGVLAGLAIAQQLNLTEVEFVSDCMEVVWVFCSGSGCHFQDFCLLQEGVAVLAKHPGWSLRHIFREKNLLADALAKDAKRCLWEWGRVDAVPKKVAEFRSMALLGSR